MFDSERRRILKVFGHRRSRSAENWRTVDVIHFVHISPVEHVECIDCQIEAHVLTKLEKPGETQIERIQRIADVGVPSDGRVAVRNAGADAAQPSHAIGAEAGHVAKNIFSRKQREGPAGLQREMLLNWKLRAKLCAGPLAVKFVTK